MKGLPIGISDFKTVIEADYFYIDKTDFIEEISKNIGKTLLFTRPRRFGKTLNMSMLKYFFDIEKSKENRNLFNGLNIENSISMAEYGKYPVLYISFKDIKENTYTKCILKVKNLLMSLYNNYAYIRKNLNENELIRFNEIWLKKAEEIDYQGALKNLSSYLYEYYNQKVIILIDEYDTPIVSAYENGYYKEAIEFFRGLYSSALKDNEYLHIGAATGILRVAKEGIFSGLNNLSVYSILDNKYSKYFGLTEEEVKQALDYYNMEYKLEEVKEWYDGYKFGNTEIYNPWSIINYIERKELGAYWIGTSDNYLINELLDNAATSLFEELKKIFSGEAIEKTLDFNTNLKEMTNPQEVWQLLLYSGYLKVENKISIDKYSLKIPNQEIRSFFEKSFINRFLGNIDLVHEMISYLKNKNIAGFENTLQDILLIAMSYHDADKNEEKYYHNLILGIVFSMMKKYKIHSNRESGYGRYDLCLEPIEKNKTGYIFEFKVAKSEEELKIKAEEALAQIEKNKYETELKANKIMEIIKIGIAFYGKKIKVISNISK